MAQSVQSADRFHQRFRKIGYGIVAALYFVALLIELVADGLADIMPQILLGTWALLMFACVSELLANRIRLASVAFVAALALDVGARLSTVRRTPMIADAIPAVEYFALLVVITLIGLWNGRAPKSA